MYIDLILLSLIIRIASAIKACYSCTASSFSLRVRSYLEPYSCTELTIAFHSAICFSSAAITALPLLRCLSTHSGAVPE